MNRATAIAEWRRGLTSLESAEVLARAGQHEDAIVTSYYAIFHAGLRSMFGLHLVKTDGIEPEWAADLGLSLEDRVKADYNVFAHFSDEDARDQHGRATAFVERIREYLLSKGLTESEIPSVPAD